jgi:hypothetical protein
VKELDAAARFALRQEKSIPLLSALKGWFGAPAAPVLTKSPLRGAVTYARNP